MLLIFSVRNKCGREDVAERHVPHAEDLPFPVEPSGIDRPRGNDEHHRKLPDHRRQEGGLL